MNNFALSIFSDSNQPFLILLLLVDLALRGIALYKSARKDQRVWFVALLVVNSAGILPLIYLLLEKRGETYKIVKTKKKSSRK